MIARDNETPYRTGGLGRAAAVGLALAVLLGVGAVAVARPRMPAQEEPARAVYKDTKQPVEKRVEDLLGRMTVEEKVSLLSGANWMETVAIPRLGIPSIKMADGPAGIRSWFGPSALTNAADSKFPKFASTAFPSGIAVAATWDPETAQAVGQALGQEVRAIGRDMLKGRR